MAGPGPKCTAARLAVASTVPAFWPGARQCGRHDHPLRAGLDGHRSSLTCSRHIRSGGMPWQLSSAAAAYVRSAHAGGSPAYRASCVP
jgi:hypothetical protein